MKIDEDLYKAYLEEMSALENFRIAYASMHPGVPLDREDPDVRRLTEAMAIFSARTRLSGSRNIKATSRRIFQQFFPHLLSPLPSMAIIQAQPSRQLSEALFFPKGSEILVSPESGGAAVFHTTGDLRILPVTLAEFSLLLMPQRGFRIALRLEATFPRNENIGRLSLCINHLNNYESSLMVLFNLKRHIKNTSIIFNEKASEESCGIPCGLSFGLPHDEDNNCLHPLQKERLFFHFPWQELFLNIDIPDISQSWTDFTILLDLDAGWPRNLVLNRDVFQLFSIPAINLRQAAAQPLICDGTRQQYTIRHPEMEYGFEVHSVKGVFEITKEGMSFIKPGIISGTSPSYETEEQKNSKGQKRHCLLLHFPAAFENPKTIVTEAIWFQPWFSEKIPEKLTAVPFSTVTPGIRWDLLAGPVPHAENLFQDSQDGLLHFLAINNRDTLDRDGLIDILQVMGIMEQKYFRHLCDLLTDIRIEKSPMYETQFSGILKHRYILKFREYDQGVEPLMDVFIRQIEKILGVWISGARIEVHKEIADSRSGLSREKDVK